jgi:hypothetical protein
MRRPPFNPSHIPDIGSIRSKQKSIEFNWTLTHDLSAYSIVPQQNT